MAFGRWDTKKGRAIAQVTVNTSLRFGLEIVHQQSAIVIDGVYVFGFDFVGQFVRFFGIALEA